MTMPSRPTHELAYQIVLITSQLVEPDACHKHDTPDGCTTYCRCATPFTEACAKVAKIIQSDGFRKAYDRV